MNKKAAYKSTKIAKADLREIEKYSNDYWGKRQTKKYLEEIHNKCIQLSCFHSICSSRSEISDEDIRSISVGSHVVFYEIYDNEVRVLRILHEKMDFTNDELFCRLTN